LGGYTVGVLVQTNFGGVLSIAGAPVGKELGKYAFRDQLEGRPQTSNRAHRDDADGSCMIVIATDAPVDPRNLKRLAARAIMGLARTGSSGSNGSGDYVIAFSTAKPGAPSIDNEAMSPLFLAAIEATEEAIYNSLFQATTVTGRGHTVEALPIDKTMEILKKHGIAAIAR
jgi:D-aminopeptidase